MNKDQSESPESSLVDYLKRDSFKYNVGSSRTCSNNNNFAISSSSIFFRCRILLSNLFCISFIVATSPVALYKFQYLITLRIEMSRCDAIVTFDKPLFFLLTMDFLISDRQRIARPCCARHDPTSSLH